MATGDWERVGGEREKNQRKVWWAERETHEEVHSPPFLSPLHFHITLSSSLYHPSVLLPQRSLLLSSFSSFFFCKLQTSAASTAPPFFHSSGKAFNPLSRTSVCITTVCFCRRLTVIYPLLHFFFLYIKNTLKNMLLLQKKWMNSLIFDCIPIRFWSQCTAKIITLTHSNIDWSITFNTSSPRSRVRITWVYYNWSNWILNSYISNSKSQNFT